VYARVCVGQAVRLGESWDRRCDDEGWFAAVAREQRGLASQSKIAFEVKYGTLSLP
jgi:hypothetical protein